MEKLEKYLLDDDIKKLKELCLVFAGGSEFDKNTISCVLGMAICNAHDNDYRIKKDTQ